MKSLLPGEAITPEVQAQWDQEYQMIARGGGAGAPAMELPALSLTPEAIQTLAEEEGITVEEAEAILFGASP